MNDVMTDREMNEAVARKLGEDVRFGSIFVEGVPDDVMDESHPIPAYSTSIAAAWEVAQRMDEPPYHLTIYGTGRPTRVVVTDYSQGLGRDIIDETFETTPLAICMAFLKLP